MTTYRITFAAIAMSSLALVACGGSGEDATTASTTPAVATPTEATAATGPTTARSTPARTAAAATTGTGDPPTPTGATERYVSTSFVVPFEVTPPDWVPAGTAVTEARPNFVTWALDDVDRAVRFFAPAAMEGPGGTATEVPDDYLAHLLAQRDAGATLDDIVERTVAGRPATILTATASTELHGTLGCEQPPAGECWGLLPGIVLRIAIIDTGDRTLLVWERDAEDAGADPIDYRAFDAMLASLRLRDDIVPPTQPAVTVDPRLPEGVYRTPELTRQQLVDAGVAAGYERTAVEAGLDNAGIETAVYGLRLGDGGWLQLAQSNGGPEDLAWRGTYQIIDDNTVIATETGTGCEITYDFKLDGQQLTLDVVNDTCGEIGLAIQTVMFEAAPLTLE